MKTYTIEKKKGLSVADYFGGNRDTTLNNLKKNIKEIWAAAHKYRYAGSVSETKVFTRTVETTVQRNRVIKPGEAFIVKLGGPFQEVGEQKDRVGGDEQKVG